MEFIIAESAWDPPGPRPQADTIVAIQVAVPEREVRQQVKAVGGKGNPRGVVWELPSGQVVALGLTERIVTKAEGSARDAHLHIDGPGKARPSTYR
ncbi:MAG: hypothetical protein HYZ50_01275 [Deltaproteobacteria bacterium]|nr:hypothetical protein [Deltaproteobacteria bacterium]